MTRKFTNSYQSLSAPAKGPRRFNLKYFNLGLILALLVFGACYLVNINDLTVKGFVLKNLKNQANRLGSINLEAQEQVNSLQSYYALNSRAEKLNMVAVDNIDYLMVNKGSVARR